MALTDPLTLDELKKMDGKPVWVIQGRNRESCWALVYACQQKVCTFYHKDFHFDMYGKYWLAYRQELSEE